MTTVSNPTNTPAAIVPWPEVTKQKLKENTDAFIDSMKPQAAILIKAVTPLIIGQTVTVGADVLKARVEGALPRIVVPMVKRAVDGSARASEERSTGIILNRTDGCVEKTADLGKKLSDKSVSCSVDIYARSVSLFKREEA